MAAIPILALFEFLEVGAAAASLFGTWVSAETATALAATATAAAAEQIGKKIDQSLYDKFLDYVPEDVKTAPDDFKKNFGLLEDFLRTNDPRKILEEEKKKQGISPSQSAPGAPTRSTEFKYLLDNGALGGTQPSQGLVVNKVEDQAKRTEDIIEQLRRPVIDQILSVDSDGAEVGGLAGGVFSGQGPMPPGTNLYDRAQFGPRDLARFLIDTSKNLAQSMNPIKATLDVLETNLQLYPLASKVAGFLADKSLPDTDEYRQIAAIYNGRNITGLSFSIATNPRTGLIEVTGIDETGFACTLPQTVGVVLPSVPGTVFMGPLSRNDELPTGAAEDAAFRRAGGSGENYYGRVEDYFSMMHDYSWSSVSGGSGNFDRIGDLKFISRLSQNLDRVRPENRALVQSTIIYFSNVSLTLGLLKDQKIGQDEPGSEDIFSVLGMVGEGEVNPEQYDQLKEEFYNVMQEEMVNYTKTDGWFTSYRHDLVETLIDDLEIQLN